MNYQVKILDRAKFGRHVTQTVFHYEASNFALTKAIEMVNQKIPMRIVLILDTKGNIIFSQGFHTEGVIQ